jgi:5'-nucleotidase/UDP-sugar diphosphatase
VKLKKIASILYLAFLAIILAPNGSVRAEIVRLTLLQLNDIYEITPVSGGKEGGLARVATIEKELRTENPKTYTIVAGDLLSPSALGTARVDGQPLAGRQMVAVLNVMGLDYATFGNHEFDLKEEQLRQRLGESRFKWLSSNVSDASERAFPGVLPEEIVTVMGDGGTPVRVGIIGLTIDSNLAGYVRYRDPIEVAKERVERLRGRADIIVAVTHLSIDEDRRLAKEVPGIDIILGGHEHENVQEWRGSDFTPIFKADANARTVYIHRLSYDTDKKQLEIDSQLERITDKIPEDAETARAVAEWVQRGYSAFRESGFDPGAIVATTTIPLDGLESSVRNGSTNLSELIAEAMLESVPSAEISIYNSGSIRIDDVLPPGNITQYDIIRILPFGGDTVSVEMKGRLLELVLERGRANRGTGGYLQTEGVRLDEKSGTWAIGGRALEKERWYRVAINSFLLTGKERGLDFLTSDNTQLKVIEKKGDVRFAVIRQLQRSSK